MPADTAVGCADGQHRPIGKPGEDHARREREVGGNGGPDGVVPEAPAGLARDEVEGMHRPVSRGDHHDRTVGGGRAGRAFGRQRRLPQLGCRWPRRRRSTPAPGSRRQGTRRSWRRAWSPRASSRMPRSRPGPAPPSRCWRVRRTAIGRSRLGTARATRPFDVVMNAVSGVIARPRTSRGASPAW